MNTKLLGAWGEQLAADYLRRKRYRIEALGYRTRYGEIDIIARSRDFIVFAEVKLRKDGNFASAREFVDRRKQERLRRTAEQWLMENETALQPRFDVIEVYAPQGPDTKKPDVIHIENAFE